MEPLRDRDPDRIAEYRIMGRLGEGGMGVVYLARTPRGRLVAVKSVRAELAALPDFRKRFARETVAAQQVGGEWTAQVLAADPEAEVPWVATAYMAGPSLREVVNRFGPLPEHSVRALAVGMAHALTDIHASLIHRDLKPSNVMMTLDGPKVIDFGIARALNSSLTTGLTADGAVAGTPAYMSPEQVRGERLSGASDIFSLGSVLAYAARGRPPFEVADEQPLALMYRVANEEPELTGIPETLYGLISGCLAKAPGDRPDPQALRAQAEAGYDASSPWLPPPVLDQLARDAVRLLDLEDPDTAPDHGEPSSTADSPGHTRVVTDPENPMPGRARSRKGRAGLYFRHLRARYRGAVREPADAVAEFEALLPELVRVMGEDHPDTLSARHRLATFRGEAGDPARAVADYEVLVPEMARARGADHRDTLRSRGRLATWRGEAGDPAAAVAEFEVLVPEMARVLGVKHRETLYARELLATYRGEAGDRAAAVAELEALIPALEQVHGTDDRETLFARDRLARFRGEAGDPAAAVAELEVLVPVLVRVLGPDHEETLAAYSWLSHFRAEAAEN